MTKNKIFLYNFKLLVVIPLSKIEIPGLKNVGQAVMKQIGTKVRFDDTRNYTAMQIKQTVLEQAFV